MNAIVHTAGLSASVPFNQAHAVKTDTRWPTLLGWVLVIGFLGVFTIWAATAPLDKGVPLTGTVTLESSKKAVQHLLGGTVESVLVKDGDRVKAGDALITLNKVQASAEAEMVRVQFFTAKATQARLQAEASNASTIHFPRELSDARKDKRVAANMELQQQLFQSRRAAKSSEWASIDQSVQGLLAQNSGLDGALVSKQRQMELAKEQLESIQALTKGGFVSRTKALELEQSLAQISASVASDAGNAGKAKTLVSELKLKKLQSMQEYQKEIRTQLSDVQKEAAALANRLASLDHTLGNIVVKAPAAGTVMGLAVFTPGAVIAPGFKIMDIVPHDDPLVIEGRLPVHLVDKLHPGLEVNLMFTAFNQNKTPQVTGTIAQISADRFVDERSGEPYYKVLAKVAPEGMQKLAHLTVKAGMPVDLFIKTGERTMANYLFKPILDHISTALSQE
jgi:membrane fusion protein, protease secretion system